MDVKKPILAGGKLGKIRGLKACPECLDHFFWNRDSVGNLNIFRKGWGDYPWILIRPDQAPAGQGVEWNSGPLTEVGLIVN